jgi:hypothetical protein
LSPLFVIDGAKLSAITYRHLTASDWLPADFKNAQKQDGDPAAINPALIREQRVIMAAATT